MDEKLLKEVKSLLKIFNGFINNNFDLILDKKRNIYTNLNLLKTSKDLIKNILEWKSRYCCSFNDKETEEFRNKINKFLNDNYRITFSKEEFLKIYIELGNGINEELTEKFIDNNFDLNVLSIEGERKC